MDTSVIPLALNLQDPGLSGRDSRRSALQLNLLNRDKGEDCAGRVEVMELVVLPVGGAATTTPGNGTAALRITSLWR
jgi:hypothetical protein